MNSRTLALLLDTIPDVCLSFPKSNEVSRIAGVDIELDERLPNHAMRIGDTTYNVNARNRQITYIASYPTVVERESTNPRDTQFAGFATLELDRLMHSNAFDVVDAQRFWSERDKSEIRLILTQCAYDLLYYQIQSTYERGTFKGEIAESMKLLKDLTSWPDEDNG